jgi:hypothetical protein
MKMIVEIQQQKDTPVDTVHIAVDRESLDRFIRTLEKLRSLKVGEHVHLMSEEWGLGDLTTATRVPDNLPVHHLRIDLID